MEWLDIVDENGIPTGEIVERTKAHAEGIRHRTAHVWLMRDRGKGMEVLLQKRSADKDSFPGCYDISSAGHIPAGVDYLPSAIRELKEELGLDAKEEDFHFCGRRSLYWEDIFYGKKFADNQVTNVYYLWKDVEPEQLTLQESEVESVKWMNLEACKAGVEKRTFSTCISLEELYMLPIKHMEDRNENTNV